MTAPRYPVILRQLQPRTRFEAAGRADQLAAALGTAGLPVPARHNSSSGSETEVRVDWLGPRRFVVSAPLDQETALAGALQAAFAGCAAADVACSTDMVVTFELCGAGACDVLAQGTPLDTSGAAFAAGSVTATDLWGVAAIVERPAAAPDSLRLTVDRSLSGYVEGWLMSAAGLAADCRPGVMLCAPPSTAPSRLGQP